jgi:hypothetical protein
MSTQRSGTAGPGLVLTRVIGLKVSLLEYVMLGGEELGGALAGRCSAPRQKTLAAKRRDMRESLDFVFEVPPNNFHSNHCFTVGTRDKVQPVELKMTEMSAAIERSMKARRTCSIQSRQPEWTLFFLVVAHVTQGHTRLGLPCHDLQGS